MDYVPLDLQMALVVCSVNHQVWILTLWALMAMLMFQCEIGTYSDKGASPHMFGGTSPVKASSVLIYITTHLSASHLEYLKYCWPLVLNTSSLVRSADVMLFISSNENSSTMDLVRSVFKNNTLLVKIYQNPGYQEGAILAIDEALTHSWFADYEWVVRVNPDVILRNESSLLQYMSDSQVDGIFVDCYVRPCPAERAYTEALISTDFFAIRPNAVVVNHTLLAGIKHAEAKATQLFKAITQSGKDRWLPKTELQHGICRVIGKASPVIHDHGLIHVCKQGRLWQ